MQAEILAALCNYLLDTHPIRREIDRREGEGQWVAGKGGEGGAFAMRTDEERTKSARLPLTLR